MSNTETADVNFRITIGVDLSDPEAPSIQIVATDPRCTAEQLAATSGPVRVASLVDVFVDDPTDSSGEPWEPVGETDPPSPAAVEVTRMCDEYGAVGVVREVLRHVDDRFGLDQAEAKDFLGSALRGWQPERVTPEPNPEAEPVDVADERGSSWSDARAAVESITRDEYDECTVFFANGRSTDGRWSVEQCEAAGLPLPHRTLRMRCDLLEPDMRALADGEITPTAIAHLCDSAEAAVRRLTDRLAASDQTDGGGA